MSAIKEYGNETIEKKGIKISIFQDDDPYSPRDNDNLCTMAFYHSRYTIGDDHEYTLEEFKDFFQKNKSKMIYKIVYMYDHSGIGFSLSNKEYPFNCPWDSAVIGYIYVMKEKVKKEFSTTKVTKKILEKVYSIMQSEIEEYNQYVSGDVYGYTIKENGEMIDSCFGFYGSDFKKNGLYDSIPEKYRHFISE